MAAKGIAVRGEIRRQKLRDGRGNLPADCSIIAVYERPVGDLLNRICKDSQNLFAECLLKTIGYYGSMQTTGNGEGSYVNSRQQINAFFKKIQAPATEDVIIDDGSGLSHRNRVTPHLLAHTLRYMSNHARSKEFIASLAVGGEDGTLKRRMSDIKGQVRAKTGYIEGVHSLSGYAWGKSGTVYCFSILANEVKADAKGRIDEICRILVNDTGEAKSGPKTTKTQTSRR